MEPPLYSVLIYLAEFTSRPDIVLHVFHICAVLIAGLILAKVFYKITKSRIAWSAGWLFTLVPANVVYTSNIMSEVFTLPFVSFYIYCLYKIFVEKKDSFYIYLLPVSALGLLMRYNLLGFWGIFLLFFLFKKKKKAREIVAAGMSVLIIISWIFINHQLNGSWGLSNGQGKSLFNRVIYQDRLYPDETNKDFIELKNRLGKKVYFYNEPWWVIEPNVMSESFGETETNNLLQKIAIA